MTNIINNSLRRSPSRSVNNYKFYFENFNKIETASSTIDIEAYKTIRHKCLSPKDGRVTGKNICACLYDKRGKIVSIGSNSYNKTHPIQERFGKDQYKIFLHAEIDAVIRALRKVKHSDLTGFNLAISRVCQDESDAQAFPCDGCINALKYYGCEGITYFDDRHGLSRFRLK